MISKDFAGAGALTGVRASLKVPKAPGVPQVLGCFV
jgi:hypothetical protein